MGAHGRHRHGGRHVMAKKHRWANWLHGNRFKMRSIEKSRKERTTWLT